MTRKNRKVWGSILLTGLLFGGLTLFIHSTSFLKILLGTAQRTSGWRIDVGNSKIRILQGRLVLENLSLQNRKETFQLKADRLVFQVSPLSLIRGKVIIRELSLLRPILSVEKSLEPKPVSEDPFQKLWKVYESSLLLQNIIFENIRVDDLTFRNFHLPHGQFRIAPTVLREIELDGRVERLGENGELSFKTKLHQGGLKVETVTFKNEKIEAVLKADWRGTLKRGILVGEGRLDAPTVLSDPLQINFKARVDERRVHLETLTAKLGPATLEAKGSLDLPELTCRASFTARDLPLESIFGKIPGTLLAPSRGMAEVTGTVAGKIPQVKIESRAVITDFRHKALYAKRAEGPVRLAWPAPLAPPVLDFDASVRPGDENQEEVHVTGAVAFGHLPGEKKLQALPQKVQLSFKQASLHEILPESNLEGFLEGQIDLKGAGISMEGTGHGKVFAPLVGKLAADLLESTITIQSGGLVSFTQSALTVGNTQTSLPGKISIETEEGSPVIHFFGSLITGFSVDGTYDLEAKKIETSAKGEFPIDWLEIFPEYVHDGNGRATGALHISGTIEKPVFEGSVRFQGNGITVRGLPDSLSNLTGTLTAKGGRLTSDLKGNLGDGSFELKGSAEMAGFKLDDFKLALRGSNLTLSHPGVWQLDFDGNLALEGHLPSPLLKGTIDIVDGRYIKQFLVSDIVLKPEQEEVRSEAWEKTVGPVRLDLAVKSAGDLQVKNNVATIVLLADLKVRGTYEKPQITGALTTQEGTIHYLGEDFALTEGRLEFSDPYRGEPYLSLTAEQAIPPTYIVTIKLQGFLSNLQVSLSSSPSLERDDILSLIAFGMTKQEIRESGKTGQSLSSKIVAEEVSSALQRPVTRATGLDIFRLEASENPTGTTTTSATTGSTLSRLALGKNLTERLSLEFKTDIAPESSEKTLQANYYLTDSILLKGFRTGSATADPRYQFNLSLRFRAR